MNRFDNVKVTRNKLIILFALSVILRFIICNYFPKTINCYPDELLYLSAAESLWNNHGVMVYNLATTFKKVGYSFFIAPAFALENIHVRMSVIGLINSVLMSAGIFPVYGLARRFFKRNNFIWLSILFYMISPSMTYSMTFASENLYIPVSLVVLYVIVEVEARWREYVNVVEKAGANVDEKSGVNDGAKADINDIANNGGNITSFIMKNIGLLILGIGAWILAYITKELALVIPLALVAYMFMSKIVMSVGGDSRSYDPDNVGNAADGACEIDGNNSYGVAGAKNKSGLGSAIKLLVAGIVIVALVYGIWWFCNRGSNYYQLGINTEILSQRWEYMLYGFGFFATISIVGLLVVPVLLPMTVKNQMNSNAKRLYYIMLLIILGTAAIVAYTIYMYEDYPSMTPRAHVRYVEYLYVPFLMVLMTMWERWEEPRAIDAAKANVTTDKPTTTGKTENIISDVAAVDGKSDASKLNWPGIIMAAVCLGGMNFIFNGFNGQTIDHTTLFYMQLFAADGKVFSPMVANLLILAITVVTLVLMGLYSIGSHGFNKAQDTIGEQASGARSLKIEKTKIFWKIFITGAIILSLGNSVLSGYIQYKTHTHSEQETLEIYDIRDFVRNHNDNTFLVMESAAGEEMLDTFLMDCDNLVYASEGVLFEQALLGDTGIDLDVAPVWGRDVTGGVNYDDIRDIDYVIVFTDAYALKGEADVIGEYPANQCVVYKLNDTRQLPVFAQAQ